MKREIISIELALPKKSRIYCNNDKENLTNLITYSKKFELSQFIMWDCTVLCRKYTFSFILFLIFSCKKVARTT